MTEIPVLETNSIYYFMTKVRLESFITNLYHTPQDSTCHSFRTYIKTKINGRVFIDLYGFHNFKGNA
ncbi:YpmP family protein [Mesobacillus maritimus]|nr:YpmP family protein [Mesobacillus maritimus]